VNSEAVPANADAARALPDWERALRNRLPLYGHRNWLVVADSAYPAQCSEGIETIVADADHRFIVERVLAEIRASGHVRASVYADEELMFLDEKDAPGVGSYRSWFTHLVSDVRILPHDDIISKLDRAGRTFRILIIKSSLAIPYTSVFFEMNCAYWNAETEMRLRSAMKKGKKQRSASRRWQRTK
jgi:hypothetical protein